MRHDRTAFLPTLAALMISMLVGSATARAETVYKCTGETGKVLYQKEPCEDAKQGEKKDIDPNKNTVEGYKIPPPPANAAPEKAQAPQQAPVQTNNRRRRGPY